jgi:multidrug resistance efflux pump
MVALRTESEISQAATIQATQAALDLARSQDRRVADLAGRGFASQEDLDKTRRCEQQRERIGGRDSTSCRGGTRGGTRTA